MNTFKNNKTWAVLFSFLFLLPVISWASAQDYRQMGQALYQKGQYAKAVGYFKQAVKMDPSDWESYQGMGDAYLGLNDNVQALAAYQKSLQINPNNPTVQTEVDNLSGSSTVQDQNNYNTLTQDHPTFEDSQPTTVIRQQTIIEKPRPTPAPYTDNLAPMDHAKVWTRFELGYDNSELGDLISGASALDSQITPNGWSGSVNAAKDGFELGAELGFLLNSNNGLAIGLRVIKSTDYTENINFEPGLSNPDFQDQILAPYVVPFTLDYYFFIPDGGGRFFLTAGGGYYFGDINVTDSFSFVDAGGSADNITGDLYGGGFGFEVGIGRDFALSDNLSLSIFGRAHYAKLSNFKGTLVGDNGSNTFGLAKFSDGTIDVDNAGNIGGSGGESYATIDFSGIDVGIALNFYSL